MPVKRLHHVSFQVTNLDETEIFASDFGLLTVERTDEEIFMRTGGGDSFAYHACKGAEPRFLGFAVEVDSEEDLHRLIRDHGATPVRDLNTPGGGKAVSVTDPNSLVVDFVHGVANRAPEEAHVPLRLNSPGLIDRSGRFEPKRPLGPAKLFRIGHLALFVPDFVEASAWYEKILGLIASDVYHVPDKPDEKIVGFFRFNRGDEPVDHHCIAFLQSMTGEASCHHVSFEAQDFDAQFMAHRFLESRGYELVWGVGRHPHGSHIFDVWRDPDRNRFETFSDTDLLTAGDGSRIHDLHDVEMDVWSSDPPTRYFA